MIRDLQFNGFVLPSITSYNSLDIPFAYPPLGLYVAAFVSDKLSMPELELLRWLPPLVSTAIIPVFYRLAHRILNSKSKAIIAALFYALTPGASDWLIMGGGLTRSFGILFSLLAIGCVYDLFRGDESKTTIGLAILFCAFAVLSHPEVGLQTAGICFLFWAYYGRNAAGIRNAALVALGTALLTAPWWLAVLHYHGFAPFWSAMTPGFAKKRLPRSITQFFPHRVVCRF
ncbi:MAG: glycosyltransferase family 39 protein [Anaerolineales bacterium]|nr:glycosyltransferase family 39 protein [Anaerolineales bacterium]